MCVRAPRVNYACACVWDPGDGVTFGACARGGGGGEASVCGAVHDLRVERRLVSY